MHKFGEIQPKNGTLPAGQNAGEAAGFVRGCACYNGVLECRKIHDALL